MSVENPFIKHFLACHRYATREFRTDARFFYMIIFLPPLTRWVSPNLMTLPEWDTKARVDSTRCDEHSLFSFCLSAFTPLICPSVFCIRKMVQYGQTSTQFLINLSKASFSSASSCSSLATRASSPPPEDVLAGSSKAFSSCQSMFPPSRCT